MKHLLALFSFVMLASTAAVHADLTTQAVDSTVLGSWRSTTTVFSGQGIDVYLGMNFKADSTADMSAICHYADGKELEAVVNVQINAANGLLEVLSEANTTVKDGGYDCSVNMVKGQMQYVYANDVLTLNPGTQTPLSFARR